MPASDDVASIKTTTMPGGVILTARRRSTPPPATPVRQRGAAMIEFGLVAMPLLLLSVLIMEAAHWQIVRQLAYVALLDAARAGATQHGHPGVIERAFAQAWIPWFIQPGDQSRLAQQRAWHRVQQRTGLPAWRIEILPSEPTAVLHARLTYLHEPLTPLSRALVRSASRATGSCVDRALQHGLLPIRLALRIEMHSAPRRRPASPAAHDEHVVYGESNCGNH